jgi:hypothetical protein
VSTLGSASETTKRLLSMLPSPSARTVPREVLMLRVTKLSPPTRALRR